MLEHPERSLRRHVLVLLALVSHGTETELRMWEALLDAGNRDLLAERAVALAFKEALDEGRPRDRWEDWLLNGPGSVECDAVRAAWDHLMAPRMPYRIDEDDIAAARALMEEDDEQPSR
ncbi:hypothetical protein [Embleya sp. NPDC001921]